VSPQWFGVLRVPLRTGRVFDDTDRPGAQRVVVISETAARTRFPGENPIGKRVAVFQGGFHQGATIIGVVGDVRFGRIDAPPMADVYIPYLQSPRPGAMLYIRTSGDPASAVGPARAALREVAPESPVYDVRPMEARLARATAQTRFIATLLGLFSTVALGLAVIGIYGVMSFAVAQRSREMGIRVALGADRGRVLRLVLGEGVTLGVTGMILGLAGAVALTHILEALLFEVSPTDPLTYVAILLLLAAATMLAAWAPARRAADVDPAVTLRAE
jgi:putative ABC transport system permease protein